ncbi:hypothetical protein HMPREF3202_01235 [Prevotella bivia]|uniref:Uncharacterized protein n=1 Tax=Prevotella bivia TaxID=28125 RepID=A0A137SXU9_9BACT|nr:hypothetical protein HMPREF3202_01235 [Prevotella bivia]
MANCVRLFGKIYKKQVFNTEVMIFNSLPIAFLIISFTFVKTS